MPLLSTYAIVALSTFFWGANFTLARIVVSDLDPLTGAAGRFTIAALAMLIIAAIRGIKVPVFTHARSLGVLGVAGVAGFNLLFFVAMQLTSPINGALIMATNPLVTALLAGLVLKEHPTRRQVLAFPLALAGVAAVILGGGAKVHVAGGDLLMLVADVVWAGYNVMVRKLMPPGNGFANTAGVMVWAALALIIAALAAGAPVTMPGPAAGVSLVVIGLAGTALAYLLYNAGLARLGAGRTALFMNLVPVFAMLTAAALGTLPTPPQIVGGMLVVIAVTYAMMPKRQAA